MSEALTGDAALDKVFRELPISMQKKLLREVMRPAAKAILADAEAQAPEQTGHLKGTLKVRAAKRSRTTPNSVSFNVITSTDTFGGRDYTAAFVNFGHRLGRRSLGNRRRMIAGKGFMQKGLARAGPGARDEALQSLREKIEGEARALGRA